MNNKQSTLEKECVNWDEIKNLPKSDLDIWPVYEGQKVRAVKIDGVYRLIDLEIAGLIEDLNKAGRRTKYCCAGHEMVHYYDLVHNKKYPLYHKRAFKKIMRKWNKKLKPHGIEIKEYCNALNRIHI